MTKEEIIELAREAGFRRDMFGLGIWDQEEFINFANLVAGKERERCAKRKARKADMFRCEKSNYTSESITGTKK